MSQDETPKTVVERLTDLLETQGDEIVAIAFAAVRRDGAPMRGRVRDKEQPCREQLAAAISDLWFETFDERASDYERAPLPPLPDGVKDNS